MGYLYQNPTLKSQGSMRVKRQNYSKG
ncbi:rCG26841 [Rattus norvegicus]|uniref:RCG26841 n=1 Tax=Rattus norvegicus TaxID=10116 RepID=A6HPV1_RAT|nr:rCG26841 [Rattus norvegicus]